MSKINFKLEPTINTADQLRKGVRREGSRIWSRRVLARASDISKGVGDMLVVKLNSSAVAKAIRGQGPEDLQAHFGLNDSTANALVDGMAQLIRSSISIRSRETGGAVSINVRAVERNWNTYLSLPGAQYVSSPSNITIPIARWLLIDPSIDIGQAAYDIVFKGEDGKFDITIQQTSRSGRAIMVSLKTLGGSGGYVLPNIISGQSGQNFIEYTLGQPGIATEVANILMKKVR